MCPATSGDINRNKDGPSSDSGGLSRSGSAEYETNMFTAPINRVVDIDIVMMTHRGFFVLTKDDQRSTII